MHGVGSSPRTDGESHHSPNVTAIQSMWYICHHEMRQRRNLGTNFVHRDRQVDYWAAVHKDHIGHESHAHENSLVSGVYYARVPSNSGRIVFEDPRGSLSPFGRLQTYFEPSEGDIVLFPSWLIHKVFMHVHRRFV